MAERHSEDYVADYEQRLLPNSECEMMNLIMRIANGIGCEIGRFVRAALEKWVGEWWESTLIDAASSATYNIFVLYNEILFYNAGHFAENKWNF